MRAKRVRLGLMFLSETITDYLPSEVEDFLNITVEYLKKVVINTRHTEVKCCPKLYRTVQCSLHFGT